MIVTAKIDQVREMRWSDPSLSWGLVPTMGYLHVGHLSLVRRARSENDRLAVSIFVNPSQFAPDEDLAQYPRDVERDLQLLWAEQVDLVFAPASADMYPPGFRTQVSVSELTSGLEGASRPTHFQGVTTVVAKLFNIFEPTRVYFGQKDAQQAVVIRRMAQDLDFNLEVVVCPIVREGDGLAMSSRNARLSTQQREAAGILYRALRNAEAQLLAGERDGDKLRVSMTNTIQDQPLAGLDYASVADPETLEELDLVEKRAMLSLAVSFGDVRLIDNLVVEL
ncbi:MAG: pantoate--beta-alanine ligase [Chloroflexota bacterium]|nr:MAG: pantoate--beta-alanine ligase [Chloroflexota bacterium]